jgi:chromosome segregation ATPase
MTTVRMTTTTEGTTEAYRDERIEDFEGNSGEMSRNDGVDFELVDKPEEVEKFEVRSGNLAHKIENLAVMGKNMAQNIENLTLKIEEKFEKILKVVENQHKKIEKMSSQNEMVNGMILNQNEKITKQNDELKHQNENLIDKIDKQNKQIDNIETKCQKSHEKSENSSLKIENHIKDLSIKSASETAKLSTNIQSINDKFENFKMLTELLEEKNEHLLLCEVIDSRQMVVNEREKLRIKMGEIEKALNGGGHWG